MNSHVLSRARSRLYSVQLEPEQSQHLRVSWHYPERMALRRAQEHPDLSLLLGGCSTSRPACLLFSPDPKATVPPALSQHCRIAAQSNDQGHQLE